MMVHPRPLFHLFLSFQTHNTILYVKKCPSSIQCWDSNPRLTEHESPPITTRSGLDVIWPYATKKVAHKRQKK